MKDFLEEYGAMVAACLTGAIILGFLFTSLTTTGTSGMSTLRDLVASFFQSIGIGVS